MDEIEKKKVVEGSGKVRRIGRIGLKKKKKKEVTGR